MIKVWLRMDGVTHNRKVFGVPIHYDGLIRCFQKHPDIDLYSDFALDNDERQSAPDDVDDRIKIIFGDFAQWEDVDLRGSIILTPLHDVVIPAITKEARESFSITS